VWGSRSNSPATQPIPPSDKQILRSGNLLGNPEYSQSTAAEMAYAKNSTPCTSGGASSVVDGDEPDDPMCRFTTVPVSAHTAIIGSQCPEWMLGNPSIDGFSLNVTAWNPRAAFSRIISAPSSGSSSQGNWHGIIRPGCEPAHTSWCQSFHARTEANARSRSLVTCCSRWPAKPGRNEGKISEAEIPLRTMSLTRSSISHPPLRIPSKRTGSKPYSDT